MSKYKITIGDLQFERQADYILLTGETINLQIDPQEAKQLAAFFLSFWLQHASTMQFDSMKDLK